jgi:hypothetical protein
MCEILRCVEIRWKNLPGIEDSVDDAIQKADLGCRYVAYEFDGRFGVGVRSVVGLVGRDGFKNSLGRAALGFDGSEENVLDENMRLFGS